MAKFISTIFLMLACQLLAVDAKRQTVIENLRTSIVTGTNARFLVDREECMRILQQRVPSGLKLQLASDVQDREYDTSIYTEIVMSLVGVADTTSPNEMDDETLPVATRGLLLAVGIPVISRGDAIDFMLTAYTNEERTLAVPYYTSYKAVTKVDSIKITSTDNIDLIIVQNGEDEMELRIEHTADCVDNSDLDHDFDDITGKDIRVTNYPRPFDWGCAVYSFGFCGELEKLADTTALQEGNVCTTMTTSASRRCPVVSVNINTITGSFLDAIPAPIGAGLDIVTSIEAEWIDRQHNTGIIFPCIRKPKYRQKTLAEMWSV